MRIGCNCIALDTGSSPIDQHKRKAFKIQKLCDIKKLEIPQLPRSAVVGGRVQDGHG